MIRTWFGKEGDKASQDAADAAYKRLIFYMTKQADPDPSDGYNGCIDEEFIFDDCKELSGASESPDIMDGIAVGTPGSVPSYLVTAMMHCPDQLDGGDPSEIQRSH